MACSPQGMVQEVVESEVSLASEVLVPLVLLQRRPSGCPLFTFSSDCSVSPPVVVVGAGSAAVSCAAAGSGGLMEVELCAESKGSPGSSASAFNLPRCPLAANKSCWSVASLGASLRTDLAVKAPCLVNMMCISAKLSRPAQMPTPHFSLNLST